MIKTLVFVNLVFIIVGMHMRYVCNEDLYPIRRLRGHAGRVRRIEFSPTTMELASICDRILVIWDVHNLTKISSHGLGTHGRANSMDWSPNGTAIVFLHHEKISLWDKETSDFIKAFSYGHRGHTIRFHPNGKWVVVYGSTFLEIVDLTTASTISSISDEDLEEGWIHDMAWFQNGNYMLVATSRMLHVMHVADNGTFSLYKKMFGYDIAGIYVSDEPIVYISFDDGRVRKFAQNELLEYDTIDPEANVNIQVIRGVLHSLVRSIYISIYDGTVWMWDGSNKISLFWFSDSIDWTPSFSISNNGQYLAFSTRQTRHIGIKKLSPPSCSTWRMLVLNWLF